MNIHVFFFFTVCWFARCNLCLNIFTKIHRVPTYYTSCHHNMYNIRNNVWKLTHPYLVSYILYTAIDIDGSKCVERVWLLRPFVACLPAWFRFMQCLRRYRDSREAFPHLANAAKYATTFFVITFSFLNLQYASKMDRL